MKSDVSHLQKLLDAVPAGRLVACLHDQNAVILHDGEKELGRIPLDGLLEVSLLDDSTFQTSYSAIKFFLLGPLAFLFPKKKVREAFRLHIKWKDNSGDHHENDIRVPTRTMAEYRLNTIQSLMIPEIREQLVQKAAKSREMLASSGKPEDQQPIVEPSPFITCAGCTVEFRKSDLPPGGKCPVCGKRLKI
jgi:predicted Zn-ribbon and HTH transcriptional regulator